MLSYLIRYNFMNGLKTHKPPFAGAKWRMHESLNEFHDQRNDEGINSNGFRKSKTKDHVSLYFSC